MEQMKADLKEREKYLQQLRNATEEALEEAPDGHLRVCQNGNKIQYYKRSDPKDFNGIYINDKEIKQAYELAQKDYNKKVIRAVDAEIKAIQRYMSTCPEKSAEQIYESLHQARQKLITPVQKTKKQFVMEWEAVKYQGKEFYDGIPEFYTAKGERVRSKSEVIIADALNREGIPYRYEYPVYIKGTGKLFPDFTVLNVKKRKELIWEHFGMMDDPEYAENFVWKMNNYMKNGYFPGDHLICTFETKRNPLSQKMVKAVIRQCLL